MFTGHYGFFEYKYNIEGYTGQDYGGFAQNLYLILSAALLVVALTLLRKTPRERVRKIIAALGVFLTLFYIAKTSWESYYDIQRDGAFNNGLLPFDTCSLIMPACLIAGFARGRAGRLAKCWLSTGGIVGGFSTMLFLNAFKYYPFLSFGALYSMLWHLLMVFAGLLPVVTGYFEQKYSSLLYGFVFHLIASAVVIPIDYIFNFDFMMYKELSSIPIFDSVAAGLITKGLGFLNPFIMLALYFAAFNLVYFVCLGVKKLFEAFRRPARQSAST